jgi:hypothetical protein
MRDFDWTTPRTEARVRAYIRDAFREAGGEASDHDINVLVKAHGVESSSGVTKGAKSMELIKQMLQPLPGPVLTPAAPNLAAVVTDSAL